MTSRAGRRAAYLDLLLASLMMLAVYDVSHSVVTVLAAVALMGGTLASSYRYWKRRVHRVVEYRAAHAERRRTQLGVWTMILISLGVVLGPITAKAFDDSLALYFVLVTVASYFAGCGLAVNPRVSSDAGVEP